MALIRCSGCGRASLNIDQKCQFCGKTLKFSIWTRKLRRKEAYGFLLIFTGSLALGVLNVIGIPIVLLGMTMIAISVLRPRRRPTQITAKNAEQERIVLTH